MKIVRFFLVFILAFLCKTGFGQNQPMNCGQFKSGNFIYTDSSGVSWKLKRTKKHQTERNMKAGSIIKHKITWLSDCEYRLTQIWTNDKNRRNLNRSWIVYRITGTTDKSYNYTCTCKDGSNKSGVVVKIVY